MKLPNEGGRVMSQFDFDFERARLAKLLRDLGIDTALEHADQVIPKWSEIAYVFLCLYVSGAWPTKDPTFTGEDIRNAAEAFGVPTPPDSRAWGGVMQRASRARVIISTGQFVVARDPKVHCNNIREWRSSR